MKLVAKITTPDGSTIDVRRVRKSAQLSPSAGKLLIEVACGKVPDALADTCVGLIRSTREWTGTATQTLESLRVGAGLSRKQMAEKFGGCPAYLAAIESGSRRLTLLYLSRYAKAANLEPWQVLRMIGEVNYGSA